MPRITLSSWHGGQAPGTELDVSDDELMALRRDGRVATVHPDTGDDIPVPVPDAAEPEPVDATPAEPGPDPEPVAEAEEGEQSKGRRRR